MENGQMSTYDAPSSTAVLSSRPEAQRQVHSDGEVDLTELQYVFARPTAFLTAFSRPLIDPP